MEKIQTTSDFQQALQSNTMLLVYFSGRNCNVCQSLKPKIAMLTQDQFPDIKAIEVETELFPAIAAENMIFTIPAILFFVDGREYLREARNISVHELNQKIEKIVSMYN